MNRWALLLVLAVACKASDKTDDTDMDTDATDDTPADTDGAADTDVTADTDDGDTDGASCSLFAGLVANNDVTTGYTGASVWSYAGDVGLAAGNAMCAAVHAGSHVCDYVELKDAAARADSLEAALTAVAEGTTIWIHRTTEETVDSATSAPGPGGRCNDWTYSTNHISDGEYGTFGAAGALAFSLDNDTVFDVGNPGVHTIGGDLQCGGEARAIACCSVCTP